MSLNSNGAISLGGTTTGESIQLELNSSGFGYSSNGIVTISLNDTAVRTLLGTPSGQIDFYTARGKSGTYAITISSNQTDTDFRTLALNAGWNGTNKPVITINAGVTVSATSTSNYAMAITGSFPTGFQLINNGTIVGRGGDGGGGCGTATPPYTASGMSGGPAVGIYSLTGGASWNITNNSGAYIIGGGGGGGGAGGCQHVSWNGPGGNGATGVVIQNTGGTIINAGTIGGGGGGGGGSGYGGPNGGGGGGGGAGYGYAGAGGLNSYPGGAGSNGGLTTGGAGGTYYWTGGAGGAAGASGGGGDVGGGGGGSGGYAYTGSVSYSTSITNTGTISGSTS